MESINVKLHQNYSDNPTEFESIDDFNNYYKINKADIDKLSTHAINLKYKVKNHRFGRKKGQLILFPAKHDVSHQQPIGSDGLTSDEKLNRLNNRMKNIESLLSSLLDALFNNENEHNSNSQYRAQTTNQTNARFNTSYI